uniref:Uncharacterized protein n=1 Tax=Rhizophora mucronata TaxID=61149 RepID=A0A2P2PR70_RHIMU
MNFSDRLISVYFLFNLLFYACCVGMVSCIFFFLFWLFACFFG